MGRLTIEDPMDASRRAWLASVERFSKMLQEQLEQARARSADDEVIRDIEQTQLKLLALWKKQIPRATSSKTRWIRREPEKTPQESTVDKSG